jgi:peptidyl-prolyl cis-trans isomerase C
MTTLNKLKFLFLILIAGSVTAQEKAPTPLSQSLPITVPATQAAPPQIAQDTVLASNGKVKVTKADFDAEMNRIPESEQFEFLLSKTRIAAVLENILINKVLAKDAIDQKLDQDQKVKDEILNQTEKVLAKYRGQQLLRESQLKDFSAAAREAYLVDPKKSTEPARYKPWHVLVSVVGRDKATARARANEVRRKVIAGDDLAALASEYSDDPGSKNKGGELNLSLLEEYEGPFGNALKKMKPGDVSEVVETRFGLHVIYLMEFLPEKKISFEAIKPTLIEEARLAYLKSNYDNYLNRIRLDPNLKIDAEALDVIRPKIPENVKPVYTPPDTIKAPPRKAAKP